MLKIEVRDSKEEGEQELSVEMMGSFSTIVSEFCSAAESIKKGLGQMDEKAEFIFVSTVTGTLFGLDEGDIAKTINKVLEMDACKEDKKDAPVDKQD